MADNANGGEQLTQEQRDQQSAEKYRAQLSGQVDPLQGEHEGTPPQRPDHIPEKFWDAEKGAVRIDELAKSYAELEKKASQPPKPAANASGDNGDGKSGDEGNGNGNETPDPYAEGVKAFTGLREQATALLVEGKPLPDELYAGFEKHGLARSDIDDWIAGQEARGTLARIEIHSLPEIGGEESYKSMIEWARANFTPEEVQVYDRDIHSATQAVRFAAAKGLAARYAQANGTSGRSVTEGSNLRTNQGYASGAEMRADMRDPRYAKDPAFREEVARKVAAARAAGVDLML